MSKSRQLPTILIVDDDERLRKALQYLRPRNVVMGAGRAVQAASRV